MRDLAEWVPGNTSVEAVAADPDDNAVVACAIEGKADCIITGDAHLLALKSFRQISIVSPATFLELWSEIETRT